MGQRGIFVIYDDSDELRQYELQARYTHPKLGSEIEWMDSPHRVMEQGSKWVSVGFEDSPDMPARVDWDDVRIHACWFED